MTMEQRTTTVAFQKSTLIGLIGPSYNVKVITWHRNCCLNYFNNNLKANIGISTNFYLLRLKSISCTDSARKKCNRFEWSICSVNDMLCQSNKKKFVFSIQTITNAKTTSINGF